jgi:hypothetical protein
LFQVLPQPGGLRMSLCLARPTRRVIRGTLRAPC